MIIKYTPELSKRIVNTDSLPRGTGAKYLLCLKSHVDTFIASQWKRSAPATIPDGYILIDFS